MTIEFVLNETLEKLSKGREIPLTRNALSVESRVRHNTVSDLAAGKSKSLTISTLNDILEALDRLDIHNVQGRPHEVTDIIRRQK